MFPFYDLTSILIRESRNYAKLNVVNTISQVK